VEQAIYQPCSTTKSSIGIIPLRVDNEPLWAKAAEGAAPAWVRRIEPHNYAAGHGHNPSDHTAGSRSPVNANAAPDKQHVECRMVVLKWSER